MHVRFLGDSFDIVKQSLLRWLAQCGPWSAHAMFTDEVTIAEAEALSPSPRRPPRFARCALEEYEPFGVLRRGSGLLNTSLP